VCSHKLIDSFFLGMMFMRSNWLDKSGYTIMFLFTLTGPLGALLGFLLHNSAPLIVQGIMTSLTTGTFLYIAMTEIISEEFHKHEHKNLKLFGFIVGLLCFSLFISFDQHSHSHGSNDNDHCHGHNHEHNIQLLQWRNSYQKACY